MTNQSRKYNLGLAGDFLVAGELLRRGFTAAVTYGNAKKADVVVVAADKAASIEVKTTCESKWIVGNRVPSASEELWIFVFLPSDEQKSPEYFVMTQAELNKLLMPEDENYRARYFQKHGRQFGGPGVVSLKRQLITEHQGAWFKVNARLSLQA